MRFTRLEVESLESRVALSGVGSSWPLEDGFAHITYSVGDDLKQAYTPFLTHQTVTGTLTRWTQLAPLILEEVSTGGQIQFGLIPGRPFAVLGNAGFPPPLGDGHVHVAPGLGNNLYEILLHEEGHAFGLAHDSAPDSVLNSNPLNHPGSLFSVSDVNSIRDIYGSVPGRVIPLPFTEPVPITTQPFRGYTGAFGERTGDANGDGVRDTLVYALGHAKLYDGATGEEARSFFPFENFHGDLEASLKDVNGDNLADLIFSAVGTSHVKVFDGKTDDLVFSEIIFPGYQGRIYVDVSGGYLITTALTPTHQHTVVWDGNTVLRSFLNF